MAKATFVAISCLLFVSLGCSSSSEPTYDAPDRLAGARAPRSAACDELDTVRCLLPWPSNTFTVADESTETGLRLAIANTSLLLADDDTERLNLSDGFSRVSPLVTGFSAKIAASSFSGEGGPLRLFSAQPDADDFGESVPLRVETKGGEADDGGAESFVFGYPLRPLRANSDYVAVVLDELSASAEAPLVRSRAVEIALGLAEPASMEEAELRAYHAPSRALLAKAGVDPARVLRIWDFTTRSEDDPRVRLSAMREASVDIARSGKVGVTIDGIWPEPPGDIAVIVEGKLTGLPDYRDADGSLVLGEDGMPIAVGSHDAPFRIVIPKGEGDYRFVMFGHGTGGTYHDDTFDADLGALGVGKVGIQFYGWTESEVIPTLAGLSRVLEGTERAVAPLMQAIADGAAIQAAVDGVLGEALSAPMLNDIPNPAEGRRPDSSDVMWVGGSLGGTMSLLATGALPEARYAVANVPGAAWTHFIPDSKVFDPIRILLRNSYGSDLDTVHAVAMSQNLWDDIDGASWSTALAEKSAVLLVQESMGDPVLPNPGNEMVAVVAGASHIGKVLSPIVGLSQTEEAIGKSGVTQYRVPDTGAFEIHGFAGRSTPAGEAAREQIRDFLTSVHQGAPKITVPVGCVGGSCDFSGL